MGHSIFTEQIKSIYDSASELELGLEPAGDVEEAGISCIVDEMLFEAFRESFNSSKLKSPLDLSEKLAKIKERMDLWKADSLEDDSIFSLKTIEGREMAVLDLSTRKQLLTFYRLRMLLNCTLVVFLAALAFIIFVIMMSSLDNETFLSLLLKDLSLWSETLPVFAKVLFAIVYLIILGTTFVVLFILMGCGAFYTFIHTSSYLQKFMLNRIRKKNINKEEDDY